MTSDNLEKQLIKHDWKSISIVYHESSNYIEMNFTGPSESVDYRAAWDKALEIATENKVIHWFFDQKKMSLFPQDLKWATEDWYPRSIKALGAERYNAIVSSDNFFSDYQLKKNLDGLYQDVDNPSVAYFKSREDALEWLKSNF
ncbi:hypothetical protein [Chondrinema litorale]|uniref:hypothetical protein n=1 Tax=Chondrinema litorale TaxID=2994555 RepID=UPI0025427B2C|nr:hypothetical protein [Chondrinema litorale]UZR96926.1 hypothetical protein OQ292_24830 [Chondrinema litorale]